MHTEHVTINLPLCIVVNNRTVKIKDLTTLAGANPELNNKLKNKEFFVFGEKEERAVFSSLSIITFLEDSFPGVLVSNEGESELIIKYKPLTSKKNRIYEVLKIAFVSLAVFFGSIFTIMTFNSDVDVAKVFEFVYGLASYNPDYKVLEISYSVGIFLGITLFFNHLRRNKMKADPTPIKVQMQAYEQGINQTIIQEAVRSGEVK